MDTKELNKIERDREEKLNKLKEAGFNYPNDFNKAEDIGESYLVNGQKVWTSYADKADWIFALVRTGPKEPKHDGISFLLIDMATKGVSTKPITLISGKSPY